MRFLLFFILITTNANAEVVCKTKLQKYYMMKVYDITLCKDKNTGYDNIFNTNFSIKLQYKISSSSSWIGSRSLSEIKKNSQLTPKEIEIYKRHFSAFFPNIKNGDEILMEFVPKDGVKFYYNDKFFGNISDEVFAIRTANIWLHPNSTFKDTRDFFFTNE